MAARRRIWIRCNFLLALSPFPATGLQPPPLPPPAITILAPSPSMHVGSVLLSQEPFFYDKQLKTFKSDTVVRILDANTIKLEKAGLVSLAGVQTPSIGGFPDCTDASPSKQLRKSLPKNTLVKVRVLKEEGSSVARALIVVRDDTLVNAQVIESGFAKPTARGRAAAEEILPGFTDTLSQLNQQAKKNHIGLYELCAGDGASINLDDQFEPLQFTTRTQWGADGGKPVLVERGAERGIPKNPGDTKGCSDFETYEEALNWYEIYQPYYGDVAKLDRDGDGVPCPKLPHTKNMDRFRRKVPVGQQGRGGAVVE